MGLVAAWVVSWFNRKSASFVDCASKREDLELVGQWLADGSLKVDIDSTFPIKDLDKAMARQADKSKVGRVNIKVLDGW